MSLSALAQICSTIQKRDEMVVQFSQLNTTLLGNVIRQLKDE